MSTGAVQYIIQCDPVAGGVSTAPCVNVGGQGYAPAMVQAYVLDVSAGQFLDPIAAPFDYVSAGMIWSFFFAFTVSLWIVSRSAGAIVEAIRKF